MPKATLVLTTIVDPVILDDYRDNFAKYGHLDEVDVIVVPDRKTPEAAFETCHRVRQQGLRTECVSLKAQETFLRRIGVSPDFIPYNSDNRRNVGFLMALDRQSDLLFSIDDDNYCRPSEDYFAAHADVLGLEQEHAVASSETKFLNICDLLEFNTRPNPYPRGFPYWARHKHVDPRVVQDAARVMINAGLWLRDPDVDAITWLGLRPCVRSFAGRSMALDSSTWAPVNSQNTALLADLIPSYYFIRMGYSVNGMPVDRYGDIFSGYFAIACANHLGGTARFGTPIADHRRNRHDYMRDVSFEWHAIVLLEDVLSWLVDAKLEGSTCSEAYISLSYALEDAVEGFHGNAWTDASRGFFHQMAYCMRNWISACRTVTAQ